MPGDEIEPRDFEYGKVPGAAPSPLRLSTALKVAEGVASMTSGSLKDCMRVSCPPMYSVSCGNKPQSPLRHRVARQAFDARQCLQMTGATMPTKFSKRPKPVAWP